MQMEKLLETQRLHLREFTPEDAPFMVKLMNSPGWLKFIGDRKVYNEEDARKYLVEGSIESYRTYGYGFYIVIRKEDMVPLGTCGLTQRPFLKLPDFGFAFLPEYTGQGYAFEVAVACLNFIRDTLDIKQLMAITRPDNAKSIRLLQKLDFSFSETIQDKKEDVSVYIRFL